MKEQKDEQKNKKPELLLHICCAPCSTVAVERMKESFIVSLFFYNPNIHPKKEYEERLKDAEKLAKILNLKIYRDSDYKSSLREWFSAIKGHEKEKEGGERCRICFELRLRKTAEKAKELRMNYFATTLTTSPHKNAELINETGKKVGEEYGINYLPSNFKKKDGFKRSIELSREYKLRRQNYCGCVFSLMERKKREAQNFHSKIK